MAKVVLHLEPSIDETIRAAIEKSVGEAYEPIIEAAKARLEKEMRAKLAEIVMTVSSYYEMYRDARGLVITVKNSATVSAPSEDGKAG